MGRYEENSTNTEDSVEKNFEKFYKKYVTDAPSTLPSVDIGSADKSPEQQPKTIKQSEARNKEGTSVSNTSLPSIDYIPVVIEPRRIKSPSSQMEKLLRMADFDQEKFKSSVVRSMEKESLKEEDTARYRAISASPMRDAGATPSDLQSGMAGKSKSMSPAGKSARPDNGPSQRDRRDETKSRSPRSMASGESDKEIRDLEGSPKGKDNSSATKREQRKDRTMENLVGKLESTQRDLSSADESCKLKPPLLLVTQPSIPNTPVATTANVMWNKETTRRSEGSIEEEGDGESEEDYSEEGSLSTED